MNCHECGKPLDIGTPLYRQNIKGIDGIWACAQHSKLIPDPEVAEIIKIIEEGDDTAEQQS